ncbi:restriction endonuclease subunit S [Gordonia sp. PKS22-38]|uniref:Restriction endonuclease subunit S n=1 Tax=Gordonia prachuapensis TaxID=3115651 RepID=A0ABU7N084_9ACTN|nr:restriction endonuclease subunit S [Gordonia sp. PKS22-38]
MTEWTTVALRDVAQVFDGPHATPRKTDDGPWYLSISSLKQGRFDFSESAHLSDVDLPRWTKRVMPRPGDTLFSYETRLGDAAYWGHSCQAALGRRMGLLRPDPERVNPRYLSYAYLGPDFQSTIRENTLSGSTVDRIPVGAMPNWPIRLPDLVSQSVIAEVLGSIDDLIENNRRRVEVLEEMARAIYREWFVKFQYPGHEDVPLVDSALGPVPHEWSVANLFNAADVGFGCSFKSPRFSNSGPFQVIRIRDIPSGISGTFTDEVADPRYAVFDDDVLIGMDGDFHMTVWTGEDAWLNQRVTRLRPKLGLSALHLLLAIEGQIKEWNRAIVGTTVAHLGKKHLQLVTVLVPNEVTLARASGVFVPMMDERRTLIQSSRRLAALRDRLLPKLVTGQIDVASLDLDALVGDRVA